MLNFFPQPPPQPSGGTSSPPPPIWADLWDADAAELAEAERRLGVTLPTRDRLSEIERSSRLQVRDGVLTMSVPMVAHLEAGGAQAAPVGFVLSRDRLVTLRYAPLQSFDAVAKRFDDPAARPTCGLEVFVELCDEITDRLADDLEQVAADLHGISTAIFHVPDSEGRAAIRSNREIRGRLRQVGRLGDRVSETRAALLGIGRAVDFACELTTDWFGGGLEPRMRSLRQDVASLSDYQVHLSDKIQFLLDAMVGLIGIAQNEVFKFLTIVSIVGIPPTLIAGIYGMNFKTMPEYDWSFGYPYGLAVIALSAILPLVWFKWRGWF
ncbi:magnesium transporter CorA family protein [Phenylobacterium sp.]|uniref:magnesium transporter CorA family protein n=1 Tax=Phenylobacterium sp. TaxID=1871053 RepID=UPI0011FF74D6|nr:magnesium transporter CorA family protein [Phenylobacterium sp.]THD58947.1 MAG: magnesium and cobalt transport protein [Phenylobacterium sp.]